MRRSVLALLLAMLVAMGFQGVVAAQESTPTAGQAPSPELCTLEPVSFEHLEGIVASPMPVDDVDPSASPAAGTLPEGEPVDDETRQSVEESMTINIACINTGAPLLQMAIYTEAGLKRLLGGAQAITEEDFELLQIAQELAEDERTMLVEFQEMVLLPDGRVAALIAGINPLGTGVQSTTLFYLLERDGHWYIDNVELIQS